MIPQTNVHEHCNLKNSLFFPCGHEGILDCVKGGVILVGRLLIVESHSQVIKYQHFVLVMHRISSLCEFRDRHNKRLNKTKLVFAINVEQVLIECLISNMLLIGPSRRGS